MGKIIGYLKRNNYKNLISISLATLIVVNIFQDYFLKKLSLLPIILFYFEGFLSGIEIISFCLFILLCFLYTYSRK